MEVRNDLHKNMLLVSPAVISGRDILSRWTTGTWTKCWFKVQDASLLPTHEFELPFFKGSLLKMLDTVEIIFLRIWLYIQLHLSFKYPIVGCPESQTTMNNVSMGKCFLCFNPLTCK